MFFTSLLGPQAGVAGTAPTPGLSGRLTGLLQNPEFNQGLSMMKAPPEAYQWMPWGAPTGIAGGGVRGLITPEIIEMLLRELQKSDKTKKGPPYVVGR